MTVERRRKSSLQVCGGRTVTWRAAYMRWCAWEVAPMAL
ncbi:hypothetical protein ERO13_D07G160701v2 [Gossypium hirsutum]|nr:hypothetical protein ERO13_D07G160701v2 [Gossypium hirsutum]